MLMFFSVQWADVTISWWGNDITSKGCEAGLGCSRLTVNATAGEYFGPRLGTFIRQPEALGREQEAGVSV